MGLMDNITCAYFWCDKTFVPRPHGRSTKKFCSRKCLKGDNARRRLIKRKNEPNRRIEDYDYSNRTDTQPPIDGETWVDIEWLKGYYQISDHGRVRVHPEIGTKFHGSRSFPGKILKPLQSHKKDKKKAGYRYFSLEAIDGVVSKPRHLRIHRLVAQAFIPNPLGKPEVNHINAIKWDNRASNLEWVTGEENRRHAEKMGLKIPKKKGGVFLTCIPDRK